MDSLQDNLDKSVPECHWILPQREIYVLHNNSYIRTSLKR